MVPRSREEAPPPSQTQWLTRLALLALALLLAAPASVALAQDPAPPAAEEPKDEAEAAEPDETVTEEITVTSRLREESLQEVPF
jgi:hypothetical protein